MKRIAFCYASGLLRFGARLPKGAIALCRCDSEAEQEKVIALARTAYDNKNLLVPGVPEADNHREGLEAVFRFTERLEKRGLKKGVAA